MSDPLWILMPILGAREYTRAAISDGLAQTLPTRLLLINQGVDEDFREELEQIAETHADRVFLWSHVPPLPSLSATWNRGLDFCWGTGVDRALVVNNDVRMDPCTVQVLSTVLDRDQALFVSAVGVTQEQFVTTDFSHALTAPYESKGGPDFSCFLISQEGHKLVRFDEQCVPAYCEDCMYHRELLLLGEGRRIFSVNLPYLHYGAGTLKTSADPKRRQIEAAVERGSRAHYRRCWGGPVNQERYLVKGDPTSARAGVTNPELQAAVADDATYRALIDGGRNTATPDC